jgi:hypothetical protein
LRNISTPVTTDFWVSRSPTNLDFLADLDLAALDSARHHVPRPEIENTSSIGIRNGWSIGTLRQRHEVSSAS